MTEGFIMFCLMTTACVLGITFCGFVENKKTQMFVRGLLMFLTLLIIEIPLISYLKATGVEIADEFHIMIWSIFAFISLLATMSWR